MFQRYKRRRFQTKLSLLPDLLKGPLTHVNFGYNMSIKSLQISLLRLSDQICEDDNREEDVVCFRPYYTSYMKGKE